MKYAQGTIGRVFLLRFEDGDDLNIELKRFAEAEQVETATIVFIGALRQGDMVAGPKKPVVPPEPNWVSFAGAWEVMGTGTIFRGDGGPHVHLHVAMGKKAKTLVGCVRKNSRVFLVIEAVVTEVIGTRAVKQIDPRTGLNMLQLT